MSQVERPAAKITIGEALEATALSAGDQPVEPSDGRCGGLAATARAAADANARADRDEDKTTLADVLADATARMGADKEVEREDAVRVVGVEVGSKPDATARPGGVAASIAAAARLNRANH
uniref:SMP domain-containing protein n=1 Tax=Leersia perrieri TaxID=77586 RepID=A0A0D9XJX9_9ORYZ